MLSVCIASIVRVPYIAHISLDDQTWSDIDGLIWSGVELNLAIVSACLPTLRPLFLHIFQGGNTTNSSCQSPNYRSFGKNIVANDWLSDIVSMTEHSDTTTSERVKFTLLYCWLRGTWHSFKYSPSHNDPSSVPKIVSTRCSLGRIEFELKLARCQSWSVIRNEFRLISGA